MANGLEGIKIRLYILRELLKWIFGRKEGANSKKERKSGKSLRGLTETPYFSEPLKTKKALP
ncbi:MAG TPA: hypothetical protein PKC69_00025 [Chitinophagaceae bacterium]|nr:hypothetical protein [Chitinophagaceae bacterium]